ncbi:hypothetical protein Aca07nite_62570 [Actinoplanes capillaceus]|uniref:CHAT domain-containing protein n=1 Tax=Actinoplanes campanulatus TaxID=113559 RepID=A0ABQ3WRR0_9ACTN|nr:CHAT domain-containing protein [Actinoplanes capillaceus]GID48982.1 hypothetical protein Aca07nite_62570 [Actinoplanes capillaceus]
MRYEEFDLRIAADGDEGVHLTLLTSPAGESEEHGPNLFTADDLERFRRAADPTSAGFDASGQELERLGTKLYRGVFTGSIETMLLLSLDRLRSGAGLRIRIRMDATIESRDLPWEAMYCPPLHRFLAQSVETPVVRHTSMPTPPATGAPVRPPLRVLVVIADPEDLPALNTEREWRLLHRAFGPLLEKGAAVLDRPATGGRDDLIRTLSERPYHALHFIGHGSDQGQRGEAVLHLADPVTNLSQPITGRELGVLLVDHPSIRLVVLNSCLGAGGGRADMTGMAGALVRTGVPAVVAMQHRITDEAAERFAAEFYRGLVQGRPVDAAISTARNRMFVTGWRAEWATAALYMRSRDGVVLAPPSGKAAQPRTGAARSAAMAGGGAVRSLGSRPDTPSPLWIALHQPRAIVTFFTGLMFGVLWAAFFPMVFRQSDEPVRISVPSWGGFMYLYELMTWLTLFPIFLVVCGRWPVGSVLALAAGLWLTIPTTIYINGDENQFFATLGGWFLSITTLTIVAYLARPVGRRISALRRRRRRV